MAFIRWTASRRVFLKALELEDIAQCRLNFALAQSCRRAMTNFRDFSGASFPPDEAEQQQMAQGFRTTQNNSTNGRQEFYRPPYTQRAYPQQSTYQQQYEQKPSTPPPYYTQYRFQPNATPNSYSYKKSWNADTQPMRQSNTTPVRSEMNSPPQWNEREAHPQPQGAYNNNYQNQNADTYEFPNISLVHPSPLCFFDEHAMVMFRPRPAFFETLGQVNRYYVRSEGYLECSFLKRLPNSYKYNKESRVITRLFAPNLGAFLLPKLSELSTKHKETGVTAEPYATEELISLPGNNWSLKVGYNELYDAKKIFLTLFSPGSIEAEESNIKKAPIDDDISSASSESSAYTVSLKFSEFKILQALVESVLPTLLGWQVTANPSLVLQYLKKGDT